MAAASSDKQLETQLKAMEMEERQLKQRMDQLQARKKYLSRLLGARGVKVMTPKVSAVDDSTLGKITTIPKIASKWMNEIEILPILKNYSYMRILYDTLSNEYFYKATE